jgi:glyceraldehyde-3-phosphate dehydrogenase (NADP+)
MPRPNLVSDYSSVVLALITRLCTDRTMQFIESTIETFKEVDAKTTWQTITGIFARVRRAAIGIMLCLGPFNYPFNETYATLIPALLAGNVIIMKIPTVGGLAHVLTMEAYAKNLPPGVLTFVSGQGRVTVSPMMKTGDIDVLAFIGGSKAADTIIKSHPHPHRLKLFLQLEGKNLGIVTADADVDNAVDQVVLGATSFNGQRCTAIKLVVVHESVASEFVPKFVHKVNQLKVGLPWEKGVAITPLPEGYKKIEFLESLISDAVEKGATVINSHVTDVNRGSVVNTHVGGDGGGGDVHGLLMRPAVVYPVTREMKLWHEEQFGPVIPIAVYKDVSEIRDYVANMPYGQQAAIFTTSSSSADTVQLVDALAAVVGRININTQCGRSPDTLPFSGRRSSALGVMSVLEALEAFSVPVVVAGKSTETNNNIMRGLEEHSSFLKPL